MNRKETFLGQPEGLSTLFFTEMWERFSYYGMRAILLFFMVDKITNGGLNLPTGTGLAIMSIYGSLVYMSSIVGGWISDRLLGAYKTVFYGGIFIMLGHIVLAVPLGGISGLFVSMIFIVIGTGMLKANISNMVGHLYSKDDLRRDAGFSIFYMGINIGALIAPIIVGTTGQKVNYHLGFSIAAIGMLIGLLVYYFQGRKTISFIGKKPVSPLIGIEKNRFKIKLIIATIFLGVIFSVAAFLNQLNVDFFINFISLLGILLPIIYFTVMLRSEEVKPEEKKKILGYIPLFLTAIVFWSIEEQGSSILALFAASRTQSTIFGVTVPASVYQTLNPLFVVILTPLFVWIWTRLGKRQPKTEVKFSIGLILAGVSYIIMMFPSFLFGTSHRVSPLWLIMSFFIVIAGEMCISPVGLSVTTKLAPKAFESQTLAIWLLADASSQAINAQITRLYNPQTEGMYFLIIGIISIIVGLLLYAFKGKIRFLIGNIN